MVMQGRILYTYVIIYMCIPGDGIAAGPGGAVNGYGVAGPGTGKPLFGGYCMKQNIDEN